MNKNKRPKYIVVGGNPFLTGVQGLDVLGTACTEEEVCQLVDKHYDKCVGQMVIIDAATFRRVEKGLGLKKELFQSARISSLTDSHDLPEFEQTENCPIQ